MSLRGAGVVGASCQMARALKISVPATWALRRQAHSWQVAPLCSNITLGDARGRGVASIGILAASVGQYSAALPSRCPVLGSSTTRGAASVASEGVKNAEEQATIDSLQALYGGGGGLASSSETAVTAAPRARPLNITQETVLYESTVDILEDVEVARFRCQLGAGLATCGFAAILASVADSLPLPALCILLTGATVNSYVLAVVSQRVIRNLATRHVERISLLPTPVAEEESKGKVTEDDEVDAVLTDAATLPERLAVTPELRVALRTPAAERCFSLVDRSAGITDENSNEILRDERAGFGELCATLGLLHIDVDGGRCSDLAMLNAVLTCTKVAAAEDVEIRQAEIPPGPMLSEVTIDEVREAGGAAATAGPPAEAIFRLGRRARIGGFSVLGAGVLCAVGEACRDPDGVPRWLNLLKLLPTMS